MSYIYYPSCNFQRLFSETAARIRSYLETQPDVIIAGCCHQTPDLPSEGDIIVTICMSCMHILEEVRQDIREISFPEFLLTRGDFSWPDLSGEKIVLQDCFRARGYHALQDAVRECLRKMNAKIVELPENRDDTCYDGSFLFHAPPPRNVKEAPKYYRDYLPEHLTILPEEAWEGAVRSHMEKYPAKDRVAGYCNTCVKSLKDAGAEAVHLAELLFPAACPAEKDRIA